ncbi:MAG TPA: ComEC/Rec2 family competence protein [Mesorhizobium sp.]|jgi:competence protein ComEC|uniref:ComEC/Rec2 family competence protein n=1 Tax=Mesorhizobium sp. TaxID=1871066 RepID=UPI002DDD6377|nr:ComEC/Rec2 family competence protein [Mesorhizobium sp.]HEV2504088.1 ComEC/Rec2 family competence protein [Mesorhizobium sp.]
MAGPGRVGQGDADAEQGINERLLFASVSVVDGFAAAASPDTQTIGAPSRLDDLISARQNPHSDVWGMPPGDPPWLEARWQNLRKLIGRDQFAKAIALEFDRGVAFLFAPVFLGAGATVYFSLDHEPAFVQLIAGSLALALVALLSRSRLGVHLAMMAALFLVLGILAGKVETWRMPGSMLGAQVSTRVTGRVISVEPMASGRTRLTLDVIDTERPKLRYQPERVRLSALAMPADIRAGSIVSGYARLMPPAGPVRPGGYDFSFESYFDGIAATGFFMGKPKLVPLEGAAPLATRLSVAIETARETIADRIRASIGGAEGEIAAALIVGVRAGIPDSVNEAMRRTGIYHIISISGLHMALVAGTVMFLLRGAFALFPDFSARRPVKKYAAFAALCSIAAYLAISGVVVAAERSFIMLSVMLIAVLFDRAALSMRNLAISAVIVILTAPHEVVGPSFQMSFAATAALIGAYAAWAQRREVMPAPAQPVRSFAGFLAHKSLIAVAGMAATSIIAGLATALFAVWHFQRVSPLSLFANLAVMPVVSFVMLAAVLSAIAMPFGADGPFLYAMGKGLTVMMAIADWISVRSPVDGVGLVSTQSVLFVAVALAIGAMATTWLRLLALPFALAGLTAMGNVETPDVLISEDARLVALPIAGNELAVSRARPNPFTLDNWRRALNVETTIFPEDVSDDVELTVENALDMPLGMPFLCTRRLCFARHLSGAVVVTAASADIAKSACGIAALIVIDDATAHDPCNDPAVVVVTKQDLARIGSAAVRFDSPADKPANVLFALDTKHRPWHAQRGFTREARGLPPRPEKAFKSKPKAASSNHSAQSRTDSESQFR